MLLHAGHLLWFGQYAGMVTTYQGSAAFTTIAGPIWKVRGGTAHVYIQ